jgi:hypothetical protein
MGEPIFRNSRKRINTYLLQFHQSSKFPERNTQVRLLLGEVLRTYVDRSRISPLQGRIVLFGALGALEDSGSYLFNSAKEANNELTNLVASLRDVNNGSRVTGEGAYIIYNIYIYSNISFKIRCEKKYLTSVCMPRPRESKASADSEGS